jgi:hypothetical protein
VLSDPVMRLGVGSRRDSLAVHLRQFLSERSCSCGRLLAGLSPSKAQLPEFLILDLDRRVQLNEGSKEVRLRLSEKQFIFYFYCTVQ